MCGSKFQVYGPTAAYIPIIVGVMAAYGKLLDRTFRAAVTSFIAAANSYVLLSRRLPISPSVLDVISAG